MVETSRQRSARERRIMADWLNRAADNMETFGGCRDRFYKLSSDPLDETPNSDCPKCVMGAFYAEEPIGNPEYLPFAEWPGRLLIEAFGISPVTINDSYATDEEVTKFMPTVIREAAKRLMPNEDV